MSNNLPGVGVGGGFSHSASSLINQTNNLSSDSDSFIAQIFNRYPMKHILALLFLPVALPYLVYRFVSHFRKFYGFKLRALEGKVCKLCELYEFLFTC